ncbi:unnamed protein product [Adineta steineri]|nr:unnamed protein product [Adineta steineri]
MLTIGIYLLNLFKHLITSWLGTILHFIINNIGEIKTIDQCRISHTFTADCFQLKTIELHKGTQEYQDHIFENEILLIISRYVIK